MQCNFSKYSINAEIYGSNQNDVTIEANNNSNNNNIYSKPVGVIVACHRSVNKTSLKPMCYV